MNKLMINFLALGIGLFLGAYAVISNAGTWDIGDAPQYVRVIDGEWYHAQGDAQPKLAYPGMQNNVRTAVVPTTKGNVPIQINQKTNVDLPRVGKAVGKFMKKGIPIAATAIALGELVCDLSDICTNEETQEYEYRDPQGTPNLPLTRYYLTSYPSAGDFISRLDACNASLPLYFPPNTNAIYINKSCIPSGNTYVQQYSVSPAYGGGGPFTQTVSMGVRNTCPAGYTTSGVICLSNNPLSRPVTEADWTAAEPKLSVPDVVNPLINAGEPVPVHSPQLQPTSKVISTTSETTRDGNGTATGTKTETTTAEVTPTEDDSPTKGNVKETTITTITNITNNTTNTTTTTVNPPDTAKPDDDIELDSVSDVDMPEQDFEGTYTPQDWGGGTCPADPTYSYMGVSVTLPVHVVCNFMEMLRMVVLLACGLIAAYIVAGVRNEV